MVNYCKETHIHTINLGHLEDIYREDNLLPGNVAFSHYPNCNSESGSVLRDRSKFFISELHKAGVSSVMAQWRDRDAAFYFVYPNCLPICCPDDEGTCQCDDHFYEILTEFKYLNTTNGFDMGFDGILFDYEYFDPNYGFAEEAPQSPVKRDYEFALPGFHVWLGIANDLLQIKTNPIFGVTRLDAYLSRVVFTSSHHTQSSQAFPEGLFNYYDQGGSQDQTDQEDTQQELDDIDFLGFDNLLLAFFVQDELSWDPQD